MQFVFLLIKIYWCHFHCPPRSALHDLIFFVYKYYILTRASLLALAKSIYHYTRGTKSFPAYCELGLNFSSVGMSRNHFSSTLSWKIEKVITSKLRSFLVHFERFTHYIFCIFRQTLISRNYRGHWGEVQEAIFVHLLSCLAVPWRLVSPSTP